LRYAPEAALSSLFIYDKEEDGNTTFNISAGVDIKV